MKSLARLKVIHRELNKINREVKSNLVESLARFKVISQVKSQLEESSATVG